MSMRLCLSILLFVVVTGSQGCAASVFEVRQGNGGCGFASAGDPCVCGRVIDANGRPVSGARVAVLSSAEYAMAFGKEAAREIVAGRQAIGRLDIDFPGAKARTKRDGSFCLLVPAAQGYMGEVSKDGVGRAVRYWETTETEVVVTLVR